VFVAEGIHAAVEALAAGADVELAVVSPALDRAPQAVALREALDRAGIAVHLTTDERIDRIQDAHTGQPIVLVVRRTLDDADALDEPAVLTSGVQDPGNSGTLLRTAAAAGVRRFLACDGGADPYHPRAVRASAGAIFRLPPAIVASSEERVARLSSAGLRVVIAGADGDTAYDRFPWEEPFALVLGSEAHGVAERTALRADARVAIPMAAGTESLSVAAAAAVLLFEAARVRARRR
jgi:TrmH family RNA methyltransferase